MRSRESGACRQQTHRRRWWYDATYDNRTPPCAIILRIASSTRETVESICPKATKRLRCAPSGAETARQGDNRRPVRPRRGCPLPPTKWGTHVDHPAHRSPGNDACRPAGLDGSQREIPRLLLRGKPGKLHPGPQHHGHVARRGPTGLQPARRVRAGHHQRGPGPRREVGHLQGWPRDHVPPAQGREGPLAWRLQAVARLQCRRRAVLVQSPVEGRPSVPQGLRRRL